LKKKKRKGYGPPWLEGRTGPVKGCYLYLKGKTFLISRRSRIRKVCKEGKSGIPFPIRRGKKKKGFPPHGEGVTMGFQMMAFAERGGGKWGHCQKSLLTS